MEYSGSRLLSLLLLISITVYSTTGAVDIINQGDLILNSDSDNSTCKSSSIYDATQQACVGLAGEPCVDFKCVSKAECVGAHLHYYLYKGKYLYTDDSNGRCQCQSGTEASPEGLCLVPHQEYCETTYPESNCFPNLKCQDGKCVCPFEDYQYYDVNSKRCITLVGGPCGSSINSMTWDDTCVTNSTCTAESDNQLSECKCNPGFAKNQYKKCDLGFGHSCPIRWWYSHRIRTSLDCAKHEGLYCIDGKCDCKDRLQVYDVESSQCRGLVGSRCSLTSSVDQFVLNCVNGSECGPTMPYETAEGVCRWKDLL